MGKCFFRGGVLSALTPADDRDCYTWKADKRPTFKGADSSFVKYSNSQCSGHDADVLRFYPGTAPQCEAKCLGFGAVCSGFVYMTSGATAGQCFFRGGALSAPTESPDRD